MKVAPALWSKVSRLELTPLMRTSAIRAGMTTGQLRCAAAVGSWNQIASSSHSRESSASASPSSSSGRSRSIAATRSAASRGVMPVRGRPAVSATWPTRWSTVMPTASR
jgi:hypothetical protein